jgi:prepilin-type N-terminal cleavage/methylation domain-containing protein
MKKAFTLIELLIVIAILGVLAVVVLVAINPAEQLARTRDAGRISAVAQLGHAVQAYYTGQDATFPTEGATWGQDLIDAGEISVMPGAIAYGGTITACTTNAHNDFCYDEDATNDNGAVVYARLESASQNNKCDTVGGEGAYAAFSTYDGRGGVVCGTSEPTAGTQTWE